MRETRVDWQKHNVADENGPRTADVSKSPKDGRIWTTSTAKKSDLLKNDRLTEDLGDSFWHDTSNS